MGSLVRWPLLTLLGLLFIVGCSSDDTPTDPGNGGGGGGGTAGINQFGAQIAEINNQYIASNAEAYASLDAMVPAIAASLASPTPLVVPSAATRAVTCFSGVAGTTYIFNGSTYEAGPATGTPSNAVRYVLYRLDASNQPVLTDSIGFIEVRCSIQAETSKSVGMTLVANGVTPISVDGLASDDMGVGHYNVTGFLAAGGVPILSVDLFGAYQPETVSFSTLLTRSDFQIEINHNDSLMTGKRTVGLGAGYFLEPYWNVVLLLHGDSTTETVTGGALYYGDLDTGGVQEVVACLSGGTFSQPTYSAPSASCDEWEFGVGPAMSSADLATVSAGYQRLKSIHDVYVELAVAAFRIPVGP